MKISDDHRKIIVDEIDFILKSMEESKNHIKIVYFFSGICAVLQRIFNLEYDEDLVFIHIMLKLTHDIFHQRVITPDPIIQLKPEHFKLLHDLSADLRDRIEKKENVNETMKKFSILIYSIGGNGYYLAHKGILKI